MNQLPRENVEDLHDKEIFRLVSDEDPNISFDLDARDLQVACLEALDILGYSIRIVGPEQEDE